MQYISLLCSANLFKNFAIPKNSSISQRGLLDGFKQYEEKHLEFNDFVVL